MSAPETARQPQLVERLTAGRPTNFPSVAEWLKAGIFRNWRGAVTSLVAAWFYLPAAVFFAVVFAVLFGLSGLISGIVGPVFGADVRLDELTNTPVVGDALGNLLSRSGGVVLAGLGVIVGAAAGFIYGLIWVFIGPFEAGPVQGLSTVVGILIGGVLTGLLYTVYRVTCEGCILQVR